jgi:transcriptional regulator with XRE-family HTH domain
MPDDTRYLVGSSKTIPSRTFLEQLESDKRRDGFVADQVRVRIALLVRALREQREWSQSDLGRVMGKPQPNISRIEDPDYGKLSLQTLFELASAFKLPLYIDMPEWDDWFRMMSDMSSRNLRRGSFNAGRLIAQAQFAQETQKSFLGMLLGVSWPAMPIPYLNAGVPGGVSNISGAGNTTIAGRGVFGTGALGETNARLSEGTTINEQRVAAELTSETPENQGKFGEAIVPVYTPLPLQLAG